jgi:hypothetical protein
MHILCKEKNQFLLLFILFCFVLFLYFLLISRWYLSEVVTSLFYRKLRRTPALTSWKSNSPFKCFFGCLVVAGRMAVSSIVPELCFSGQFSSN